MIKCFYDLHIHSSLSPCGSREMTLSHIVNEAMKKGLDMIALTDHNSAKNVLNLTKLALKKDILVIPGIEVESYEGIHLLCYFQTIKDLSIFSQLVYKNIPRIKNDEEYFGEQLILDENDVVMAKEVKLLLNSTYLKLNEIIKLVHLYKGIVIAAHIDKKKSSLLTILGFIPPNLRIDGIEISKNAKLEDYIHHKVYKKYRIIQNSDAHYITDICEKMSYFLLEEKSISGFFRYFGDKK